MDFLHTLFPQVYLLTNSSRKAFYFTAFKKKIEKIQRLANYFFLQTKINLEIGIIKKRLQGEL